MARATVIPTRRIGLSMRTADATEYVEPRDALALDWSRFLSAALPGIAWLPIPNIGQNVGPWLEQWQIEGLILTGGETPGASPRRDETEFSMLDYALARHLPVLGICRGMQMMQVRANGQLIEIEGKDHIATRHSVIIYDHFPGGKQIGDKMEVNSFHRMGFHRSTLMPQFHSLAEAEDGCIEAMRHNNEAWLGLMWHPEREVTPQSHDMSIIAHHFG